MALRLSKGLRNFLLEGGSLKRALANGAIEIYSGSQPTTADDAVAGSLLATITLASGTRTKEVKAVGALTLSGTSGSANTFTLNGIEIMGSAVTSDGTVAGTATKVATAINNNPKNTYVVASTNGADGVITLTALPGFGTLVNTWVPAGTGTTISFGSATNMTGGVNAVNGLTFGDSVAGAVTKNPLETWSGTATGTGTAGWFRYVGSIADAGAADSSEVYIRIDGNVGTSGANLNMSSTSIVTSAVQTISTFSFTEPAQ